MPTITLKNVPDALLARLRLRAVENRRSLNQEAITLLEQGTSIQTNMGTESRLARLRSVRDQHGLAPLTEDFLREAKTEGRR